MIRFSAHSIRRKLMLMLLITSLSVLTFATLGFAVSDWVNSKNEIYNRLRSQAGIIGNNSHAALTFQDMKSAQKTLATLESEANIVAAVLYDDNGQYFSSYQRDNHAIPKDIPNSAQGSIENAQFVLLAVKFDGEVIGHILLMSELGSWRQQQLARLAVVFALFLLAVAVAVWLSSKLQQIVAGPIIRLADTARKITETKDFALRAEKLSKDEIGRLVDDFNEMLNQIQLRDSELLDARQQLEEKVTERTSELYELTKRLEYQANHDALTGLVNRDSFDGRLKSAINYAQRHECQQAVFFLDLDRFKGINDTLGHGVGDKLLIEVASRLSACLRKSDTLARLGGDEFAVLLLDSTPEKAAEVADKLIQMIHEPVSIDGYNFQVSTSLGISIYPHDGLTAEDILKNADTAMYFSKESGRDQFSFYAREMNSRAERRLLLEAKLRKAISETGFRLHYQPKWDINSRKMVGVEALIRWHDEVEGDISPAEFIPLAEECGLIGDIDNWVLKTACREILELYSGDEPGLLLSVNFSVGHFISQDVYERVADTLKRVNFPGHCLELEITETVMSTEISNLYEQLKNICDLGVEISIDDFGVAYSSLSRLKQLPLSTLKIDRSFIRDIGSDSDDEVIVKTIIDMAHNLNLKVVAEGVETPEQYQFVKQHYCDVVQGFLFGKPVPLSELAALLAEGRKAFESNLP